MGDAKRKWSAGIAGALACLLAVEARAQVAGALGGRGQAGRQELTRLSNEDAGAFIAIDGTTPGDCWTQQRARREAFVSALGTAGIAPETVQVDFISMLPVYEWKQEEREGESALVERLVGHRLQENVHVAVADEEAARRVIELAMANGVHDVLAVEYWSAQTPAKRREALESALEAAKSKADLLLAPFATRPKR